MKSDKRKRLPNGASAKPASSSIKPKPSAGARRDTPAARGASVPKKRAASAGNNPRAASEMEKKSPKAQRKLRGRKPRVPLPPALLEKEEFPRTTPRGPGERFALGIVKAKPDVAGAADAADAAAILPEEYGTERLFLAARDPRCLYAYWDLTAAQRERHAAASGGGSLALKIYSGEELVFRTELPKDAHSFFAPVGKSAACYTAELGMNTREGGWRPIARSNAIWTPPDRISENESAEFVSVGIQGAKGMAETVGKVIWAQPGAGRNEIAASDQPRTEGAASRPEAGRWRGLDSFREEPSAAEVPMAEVPASEKQPGAQEPLWRVETGQAQGQGIREAGRGLFPESGVAGLESQRAAAQAEAMTHRRARPAERWTRGQARALERILGWEEHQRARVASMEITEAVRRELELGAMGAGLKKAVSSEAIGGRRAVKAAGLGGVSSEQAPAKKRQRGFWMNVNAELVVYGATEADASVRIGGKKIKLRPDGTFSFRFALPDGAYELAIAAEAADGEETREAVLEFRRQSEYRGQVWAHPQGAELRVPASENVS